VIFKINFCDFWPGFEEDNYFLTFLNNHFNVVVDHNPDYLFYSVYGYNHLKYTDCIKILYTEENFVPDFNLCDYALGFHYLEFGDRYMRFTLYLVYPGFSELQNKMIMGEGALLNRKFYNFIQ
jgi:alpha(1,3/1,4) fucosyltransferase